MRIVIHDGDAPRDDDVIADVDARVADELTRADIAAVTDAHGARRIEAHATFDDGPGAHQQRALACADAQPVDSRARADGYLASRFDQHARERIEQYSQHQSAPTMAMNRSHWRRLE